MTTPSPITRGTGNNETGWAADVAAPYLAPQYVIVDVGTDPLPDVRRLGGDSRHAEPPWGVVGSAQEAGDNVRHGLAVMQAIHDRDTAPKRHPLAGLGVGSIAQNISDGDGYDWRLRADGMWVPLDDDQQDEDCERTMEDMNGDWVIRHREPAVEPTPAAVPFARALHDHRGNPIMPYPARYDVNMLTGVAHRVLDEDPPAPAPRVYRVGDVIASNAEPEPPRTAVLRDRDGAKTRCVNGLWTVSGGGGASWSHRGWFPMRVVSL